MEAGSGTAAASVVGVVPLLVSVLLLLSLSTTGGDDIIAPVVEVDGKEVAFAVLLFVIEIDASALVVEVSEGVAVAAVAAGGGGSGPFFPKPKNFFIMIQKKMLYDIKYYC